MSEWQPISTAPKDGSCFLGVEAFPRGHGGGIYSVCVFYNGRFESADDGTPRNDLTHWQPLSEAPCA